MQSGWTLSSEKTLSNTVREPIYELEKSLQKLSIVEKNTQKIYSFPYL